MPFLLFLFSLYLRLSAACSGLQPMQRQPLSVAVVLDTLYPPCGVKIPSVCGNTLRCTGASICTLLEAVCPSYVMGTGTFVADDVRGQVSWCL
jgi:hypothetical protein